jgi:hypothetical protein
VCRIDRCTGIDIVNDMVVVGVGIYITDEWMFVIFSGVCSVLIVALRSRHRGEEMRMLLGISG